MNSKSGFLPWLIWALAALFVVFNYVQQVVPNVIADELSHDLGATAGTLGSIAACYYWAYALLQIPVGMILDRYGTRWPLVIAIFAAGLGTLVFSRTHGPGSAQIARLLMGGSAAFSFIGCLKLVQTWFPPSKFSTLAGMTNMAGMLGFFAAIPVVMADKVIGWRETLAWLGGAELLLALLVFALVRDGNATVNQPASRIQAGEIFGLLRNPQAWINAAYATSICLIFAAFGGLWGTSYIEKVYGLDPVAAVRTGAYLTFGGILGSLFYGWISDYIGKRKSPMVQAGIGSLISMACLLYIPNLPLLEFKLGLVLVGFFTSANIVSYAVARDLYPQSAGFSIGFLSTCYFAGSAASQPLVGMLLEHSNPASKTAGLAVLTPADYRFALSLLVIFMLVGLIASVLLKETLKDPAPRLPC